MGYLKILYKIILLITFIFFFYAIYTANGDNSFSQQGKLILVPIDYSNFFCSLCLDSFLSFSKELSVKSWQGSIIWIIVFSQEENPEKIKILEKKLRGLFKTHNINFPILVDRSGVFNKLEEERKIILIDTSNKIIKGYKFPLSPKEKREILMPNGKHSEEKGEKK